MFRRTNPAAILRAFLALCLAWPAAFPGEWAGLGAGATASARGSARSASSASPQILARGGHDGPTVAAAPGAEDRDVEDADGADSPHRPAAALLPDPATPWPASIAVQAASTSSPAGCTAPSPRLIAIRC